MHLTSCLHPVKVWNKYLGSYMYVPCRKCDACLNIKRYDIQTRIIEEVQHHKYAHFFTLTYDDDNVCCLKRCNSDVAGTSLLYSCYYPVHPQQKKRMSLTNYTKFIEHFETGELHYYDMVDEMLNSSTPWNDFDCNFVATHPQINVVNKRDVQLFIKRLRKYAQEKFKSTFRFFVCAEYGPKTYRPHYHGIIFHDCPDFAKVMRQSLRETWALGFVNTSLAGKNAPQYVAKYVSGFSDLPKVLQLKDTAPFFLCSRRPYLGTCSLESEEVSNIVHSGTNVLVRVVDGQPKVVTFNHSFEDRLFPKCRKFGALSHNDRVTLYRCAEPFYKSLDMFDDVARQKSIRYEFPFLLSNTDMQLSLRVCKLAKMFQLNVEDYVTRIEEYYSWKDYQNLKAQYEFQDKYMQDKNLSPDVRHLLCMYPSMLDDIKTAANDGIIDEVDYPFYLNTLKEFGFTDFSLPAIKEWTDVRSTIDYKQHFALSVKMKRDSMKTKELNDSFDLLGNHKPIDKFQFNERTRKNAYTMLTKSPF